MRALIFRGACLLLLCLTLVPTQSLGHGPHAGPVLGRPGGGARNLTVLTGVRPRELRAGMERLSAGLGVECTRCHVEGAFHRDDLLAKAAARHFLGRVLDSGDRAARAAAFADFLRALGELEPVDEGAVWAAVDRWTQDHH